jgi:hypothetical protein
MEWARIFWEKLRRNLEFAEEFDDFDGATGGRPSSIDGLLAGFEDGFVHFVGDLGDDLLDAGGMDPAVEDETLHGFAGDFAADGVEAGEDDGVGGVVDEDGDAGGGFEGADIAAFAADDAAFDVIALEGNGGGGGFEGVIAGVALDGDAEDSAGFGLGPGSGVHRGCAGEVGGVAERGVFGLFEELMRGLRRR